MLIETRFFIVGNQHFSRVVGVMILKRGYVKSNGILLVARIIVINRNVFSAIATVRHKSKLLA
jgi:hypothetical protein